MYRFSLSACALLAISSSGWAGAESFFTERTHDFGATPRGPQLTHYFRFTNSGTETLTINSLRVSCGCVTASAPVAQIKPGESSYITAQMDSRRFTGPKAVTIYVQTSSPRLEEITLLVKANGRDDISIYPEALAFGAVRKGSTATSSVQVTFLGDANWKIDEAKSDSNYVKTDSKLVKRNGAEVTYEISATLRSDLPPGKWLAQVWLQTNSPNMGKIQIPISVNVNAPITASPGILELGDVKIGDSVEQNVLVRGDKPFKIKAVRAESLRVLGISTEAKTVHVLKIEFKPTATGEVNRAVAIITDDGNEPAVTIPVKARAVKD